jgi:DNA polymerase III epsilon subunit-like protein
MHLTYRQVRHCQATSSATRLDHHRDCDRSLAGVTAAGYHSSLLTHHGRLDIARSGATQFGATQDTDAEG